MTGIAQAEGTERDAQLTIFADPASQPRSAEHRGSPKTSARGGAPAGPRVVLIANNFPPVLGGSAVVYDNLARHAAGQVIVVAPKIAYADGLPLIGWREHDRRADFPVIRIPLLRTIFQHVGTANIAARAQFRVSDIWIWARLVAVLLWLVVTCNVRAVCVGELLASGWILSMLRWVPGIRTIVYVHGEELTTEDPYDPGHLRPRRGLLAADRVIVVSRFTHGCVIRLLGERIVRKLALIENGVDTVRFRNIGGRRQDLVQLYRLDGCFVFVSVCRLLEKKGIDNAIRGFARVVRAFPDCRFLVVGTGQYQDALAELAHDEGVADDVVFAGQVADDDLVAHYCLGDVFAMPNRRLPNGDTEGFGLVFLEANSCGMPVIAGRDGGSADAVRHGDNGIVVDGHSVDEIAAAMLRLRGDRPFRDDLRRRGMVVAAAADWSRKCDDFLSICLGKTGYRDSLSQTHPRRRR